MIKNIFPTITKNLGLKETKYFQVFLILAYIAIILFLIPTGIQFLKSLICFAIFALYFLPYLISNNKKYQSEKSMFLLNLFLGWTIIAWIILLIIALTYSEKKKVKKRK